MYKKLTRRYQLLGKNPITGKYYVFQNVSKSYWYKKIKEFQEKYGVSPFIQEEHCLNNITRTLKFIPYNFYDFSTEWKPIKN